MESGSSLPALPAGLVGSAPAPVYASVACARLGAPAPLVPPPPAASARNQSSLPRRRTTSPTMTRVGGSTPAPSTLIGERPEGAFDDPLALRRALLDEGGGDRRAEPVLGEPRADLAKADQPHVDDHRLARPRHRRPVEGGAPVLEVPGDEGAGVGVVAVGEGDARVRRAARRRGHPGHDLERDPLVGEGRDLLPAPPEDERVPALQAEHPPPLARETDEEPVDVGLADRVLVAPLPRVDPFRVAPREGEHAGRHEAVVHHHVRLLHEAHRAERQEVRVAGAGPDEVDLAGRGLLAVPVLGLERRRERHPRLLEPARERHLRDRPLEHPVPERPPVGDPRKAGVHFRPGRARKLREAPERLRNEGLEPGPDVAGERRGGAACRDGREHRRAVDDGGHREVSAPGVRGAVREDPARLGELDDPPVEVPVIGRRDDEPRALEVGFLEPPATEFHQPALRELRGPVARVRSDHPHPPAGRREQLGLARPDRPGPHHQARPAAEVQEDGELFHLESPHRVRCLLARRAQDPARRLTSSPGHPMFTSNPRTREPAPFR